MARLYSDSITMQSAAAATGSGTAVNVQGYATMCIQLSGTMTSLVVTFEATVDNTNWIAVQAANANTGALSTTATAAGLYVMPCAGFSQMRARVSTWVSGAVTAVGLGSTVGTGATLADIDIAAIETMAIDQTTPGTTNGVYLTGTSALSFGALTAVAMGNASASAVVAANASRRGLIITNASTVTGYMSIGDGTGLTTANYLFSIEPGETISLSPPISQQAIAAICGAATKNVAYQEAT